MNKAIYNITILLLLFFIVSCNKKVCPAYFSSFQPKQGSANEFFAYFEAEEEYEDEEIYGDDTFLAPNLGDDTLLVAKEDTFKNSYGLLVFSDGSEPIFSDVHIGASRNKNGIVKKSNFISNIFSNTRQRQNKNHHKRVSTKNPRPFKIEEVEEDSTHQIVQKKEPPKLADQLYYEMEFGNPDAVDSTAVEGQNAGDSLATELTEEEIEESTGKKGKKKKKGKRKKKKKKKKDQSTEDDFNDTEVISEDLVLPEKKKKKKKKKSDEDISESEDDT